MCRFWGKKIFKKVIKKDIDLCIMSEQEFKEFDEILRKAQEEVRHSKAAAEKLLTQLGDHASPCSQRNQ